MERYHPHRLRPHWDGLGGDGRCTSSTLAPQLSVDSGGGGPAGSGGARENPGETSVRTEWGSEKGGDPADAGPGRQVSDQMTPTRRRPASALWGPTHPRRETQHEST